MPIIRTARLDPIRPGISIGRADAGPGTIGAIVYDLDNAKPYALSNWHVLMGPIGKENDEIYQPGASDVPPSPATLLGVLVRGHWGDKGDGAICTVTKERAISDLVLDLDIVPRRTRTAQVGDRVVKSSRKTGVTYGVVENASTFSNQQAGADRKNIPCMEIMIDPLRPPADGQISQDGDSGACWLLADEPEVAVGLHFAGRDQPHEMALACDITQILEELRVSLERPTGSGNTPIVA